MATAKTPNTLIIWGDHISTSNLSIFTKGMMGYATGQFGKNHFGDKDEFLPTNHGFDELFGFLYHLNALEEPELPDYPPGFDFPNFKKLYSPRGLLDCKANPNSTQSIRDTGPLNKKRMETLDDEVLAKRMISCAVRPRLATPSSYSSTHRTCTCALMSGPSFKAGQVDGSRITMTFMIEHDEIVGKLDVHIGTEYQEKFCPGICTDGG